MAGEVIEETIERGKTAVKRVTDVVKEQVEMTIRNVEDVIDNTRDRLRRRWESMRFR